MLDSYLTLTVCDEHNFSGCYMNDLLLALDLLIGWCDYR